jgi:hypothetical protein
MPCHELIFVICSIDNVDTYKSKYLLISLWLTSIDMSKHLHVNFLNIECMELCTYVSHILME